MDSKEKTNIAPDESPSLGEVARRVGGVLANLVPNSKPLYRDRLKARAEPNFSMPAGGAGATAEGEIIHNLDAQREKRGAGIRDAEPPRNLATGAPARNLDALRKKKTA